VAGALGVLLGGFGVHRFYLGFPGIAVAQIAATILTFGVVGPIWGFIEGILCFCGAMRDVDGLPLRG
jgi:TM2 domain-containing membrane protein YozV